MTLQEIKDAVLAGKRVCWANETYVVEHDSVGQWLVHCKFNDSYHGLTWRDGVTVNGKPHEFFTVGEKRTVRINTGCHYDSRGQAITLFFHPEHGVVFCDHSRGIEGYTEKKTDSIGVVVKAYVRHEYVCGFPSWITQEERFAIRDDQRLPNEAFADWSSEYRNIDFY